MKYAAQALPHNRGAHSYSASDTPYTSEHYRDAYTALLRDGARIVFVSGYMSYAAYDIAYRLSAIIYALDS